MQQIASDHPTMHFIGTINNPVYPGITVDSFQGKLFGYTHGAMYLNGSVGSITKCFCGHNLDYGNFLTGIQSQILFPCTVIGGVPSDLCPFTGYRLTTQACPIKTLRLY